MKNMKPIKISFLFNQLTTPTLCTGGEIRGFTIASFFKKNKNFKVEIITSEASSKLFPKFKKKIIGHQKIEKYLNRQTLFSSFVLFIERTIISLFKLSFLKTDIIYCTGDFFCDIIPTFFTKIIYPKTKAIVCIHHINQNPFKRKTNSFISGIISYLVQQLSFFLIKQKFDLIFVVNHQVKQYLLQKKITQPIIVVGNGLDIKTIKGQIENLNDIQPSNHISYFGRLSVTKGVYDLPIILAKVLKKYPNTQLDVVGASIPQIKNSLIEKFNQQNCQDHFHIHDFIKDKKDIFKILLQSKVIIFPSYEEGWGISLFESIMTKRPVVTYNLPIFDEIFEGNLITAPLGDTKTFAQKTIKLIDNYQLSSTKNYIKNCYKIAQKYSWEKVFLTEKKYLVKLINQ